MRLSSGIGRGYRIALDRLRSRQQRPSRFDPFEQKNVLFVFDNAGAWARYRCEHQAEQLALLGVSSDIVQSGRIDLAAAVDYYESFVLNRVEWRDELAAFFERARTSDKPVLFDTDDLIFEPDLSGHLAFLDGWPEAERRLEIERLDRYRRTLEACGCALVATEPLAEYARRRVEPVSVAYNAVSAEMVRLADRALESPRLERRDLNIAYLSGTRTHDRDFLEAADAVIWALQTYPQTRFLAVGKLELDGRFAPFASRLERIPLRPWQQLPELLCRVDVNLAPLERDNPFTECKSCVKFLEAGLLGVPTIASKRPDFVRVIEHGENGFLADGPDEWQDSLGRLIESAMLRDAIGAAARDEVRSNHTTEARAQPLARSFATLAAGAVARHEPERKGS